MIDLFMDSKMWMIFVYLLYFRVHMSTGFKKDIECSSRDISGSRSLVNNFNITLNRNSYECTINGLL